MAVKVIVVGGRAYYPTGEAVGYRAGEVTKPFIPPAELQRLEEERKRALEIERIEEERIAVPIEPAKLAPPEAPPPVPPYAIREPTWRERVYGYVGVAEEVTLAPITRVPYIGRPVAGLISMVTFLPAKTIISPRRTAKEVAEAMRVAVKLPAERAIEYLKPKKFRIYKPEERRAGAIALGKVALEMAVTAGLGYGIFRGYRAVTKPKVIGVKVPARAKEIVRIPKARRAVYEVKAEPVVMLKKPFRKPYPVKIKVVGEVGVKPFVKYPKRILYEARAVYKAPKVGLIERARGLVWRKPRKITAEIGAVEIYKPPKLKPVERITYVGRARRIARIKAPMIDRELYVTIGEMYPLGKRPPMIPRRIKPVPVKGMMIVERIPEAIPKPRMILKPPITPAPIVKPVVIPKPPAPPMVAPITALARRAVAPMVAPKPIPTRVPFIYPPMVKPVIKPKPIVKPAVAPPITITAVKVKPAVAVIPRYKMRAIVRPAVKPAVAVGVKEIAKVKEKVALVTMVAPMVKLAPRLKAVPPIGIFPPAPPIAPTKARIFPFLPAIPIYRKAIGIERIPVRARYDYVPSYSAFVFKVYGRKTPPRFGERYMGFELRKIPRKFRWGKLFAITRRRRKRRR